MGVAIVFASAPLAGQMWRSIPRQTPGATRLIFVSLVAASAVLMLLVRAPHDPAINQGNPSTPAALFEVIARRQYDVPGLWPRSAPLWLQLADWVEDVDWRVGRSVLRA